MIDNIYIERSLLDHPRAIKILAKYSRARVIECEHYGEIFNRRSQNFRLQKQAPALILARKNGRKLYPTPPDHALGAPYNYYFSHLLNCPFDCRYCFLQGKFSSAYHVLFVNYEDFLSELTALVNQHDDTVHIFSGYDCDSLALEPVSGFSDWLINELPQDNAYLVELRTKSTQIRQLRRTQANDSCLIAYSLSPQIVIDNFEHGTANLAERLSALQELQNNGWRIGLRIDPLIDFEGCEPIYNAFFAEINQRLSLCDVHSITLGTLRFPEAYFKKIQTLYPNNALLASVEQNGPNTCGYSPGVSQSLLKLAYQFLSQHIESSRIFVHHPEFSP